MMINYDSARLSELAQAFYTLSGMRIGLLDPDAVEFFAYPSERSIFCTIARSHPQINKKCIKCDLEAFQKCKKTGSPIIYQCHLGLTEVIAPVKEDDIIICYFMFGQIIVDETKEQSRDDIYNHIKTEGFDEAKIKDAIKNIKSVNIMHVNASVKMMEAILSYMFSNKLVTLTKVQFINQLNSYIASHFSKDIHIDDLCKYYGIGRTRLYELSKSYLDCGLYEYVTHQKIIYAQKLLKETSLNIMDIAEEAGFSDYNYFSRVFRKRAGVSPRQYRTNSIRVKQN
jgi:YesN/AraC family two-component response regulator